LSGQIQHEENACKKKKNPFHLLKLIENCKALPLSTSNLQNETDLTANEFAFILAFPKEK